MQVALLRASLRPLAAARLPPTPLRLLLTRNMGTTQAEQEALAKQGIAAQPAVVRLRAIMAEHKYNPDSAVEDVAASKGWDDAWYVCFVQAAEISSDTPAPSFRKEGATPWDMGSGQLPLVDVFARSDIGWTNKGHALVPGCGRVRDLHNSPNSHAHTRIL